MDIILYSTAICPQCHRAREFLKESGHSFREIDLGADKSVREDLIQRCGVRMAPIIEINGNLYPGFNRARIAEVLVVAGENGRTQ